MCCLEESLSGACVALRAGALGLTADGHVVERWFFWVGGPGAGGSGGGAAELAERLRAAVAAPHPPRSDPRDALRQAMSSANPCPSGARLPYNTYAMAAGLRLPPTQLEYVVSKRLYLYQRNSTRELTFININTDCHSLQ